ncbi:iron ABC transporter substrate-binding protein [Thermodesulfovibrio yellowstonii]|uniref:Iron ABC transporter substrate-binding protein n=1 Tax=Thermodesulfovibrio yellowstonii TaxID=28262 RepID=A0A9W6GC63_9BACT|nr:iron ABC transporter substrate-binding protein [Thermodesulfovibrio islandicus]GLI52464.1 iron ABC transporter substrate-binding protein [Thermodesulfovibrio islandicus]GLI53692.1 iron ABC transporter substrate-binding protein [Thermodesulfovibrio islandicus]
MRKFLFLIFLLLCFSPAHAKDMIKITDMAGREVLIPKKIERIVALSGSVRYVIYLQAFDKLVGIEGVEKQRVMRGNPSTGKAYWLAIKDKVEKIPSIGEGGPGKLPDFEKLISVRPDIVITFEVDNAQLIQSKTGIPVIVLKYAGTEGFRIEDIKHTFSFLGRVLGREKRAEELNRFISQCVEDLSRRTSKSKRVSVYVGAISARGSHGITSTEADYPPLKWLNVRNVADETGKRGHIFIDKEMILRWNPDYVFIDTGGLSLVNEDYIKNREFYKKLKAVAQGKVYTLFPNNFYRTNLEIMIVNAYFIGKVVYPQNFKDVEPRKKAKEVFEKFLGRDIYDELRSGFKGYGKVEFKDTRLTIH